MPNAETPDGPASPFLVGVGASAGGLEALERFFSAIRPTGKLAFAVVQHLSPDFKSVMDELLARHTTLAIRKAESGIEVEPDTIYLLPPRKEMLLAEGRLALREREPDAGLSLPIDVFFTSLAQDAGRRAVAVVLSGTGSDGSRGVRAVHEAGGLVFAQSEDSAKFDGMPRSAVDTGVVDFVLPPEEIAAALLRLAERGERFAADERAESRADRDGVDQIVELLRKECGVDFSAYKPTTVSRRIERRALLGEARDVREYLARLERDPAEVRLLYRDLLIGVTRFLRDPEAFERLRRDVLPGLVDRVREGDELRVWVPGCATGEEAYTLAMLAHETFRERGRPPALRLFATDVHRASLDTASAGVYPADAVEHLAPELRERYFVPQARNVQVTSELRRDVVFAHHNVLRDAPFTRLDLVSCRNLLIYFQPGPQRKAIALFLYALKLNGVLFLGPSESPGGLADEFTTVDPRWKLFRKRRDVRLPAEMPVHPAEPPSRPRPGPEEDPRVRAARDALLQRFAPPTLVLDEALNVVHALNGAGRYLAQRDGRPTLHLPELLQGELRFVVAAGLKRVAKEREPAVYTGVSATDGERVKITVAVADPQARGDTFLVSFEREQGLVRADPAETHADIGELAQDRILSLEAELRSTRENLQATVEEMETGNEELQATNEELIASNEELQSTNEELHSVNEELYTVNAEYQAKIAELTELTADVNHLLEATQVHTLFLDRDLRLRKFTPRMAEFFNLLPQDLGRPIEGFAYSLDHAGLMDDLRRVLASGEPLEREVPDRDGDAYLLRVLPYRPAQVVQGVVVTLVDVSALKQAAAELRDAEQRWRTLVRAIASVVFTADAEGRFAAPQAEWEAFTGQGWEAQRGEGWLSAVHPSERDAVRAAWEGALAARETCTASGRIWHAATGSYRYFTLRAAPVLTDAGEVRAWVGNVIDVHTAKLADTELHARTEQLRGILDHAPMLVWAKDTSGRYLFVSRSCAEVLGVSATDAVGKSDEDLLPAELAAVQRAKDRRVRETGELVESEELLPRRGEERSFLAVRFPLRDAAGRVSAVVGMATDITERKRAAEESRLELARRDRLLAMLSHELRTPLGAVVNAVQLLERSGDPRNGATRALDIIRRQSQHMARLIDDLLDVARLTRNQLQIERVPLDLASLVRDAVHAAEPAAQKKGLRLSLEVPEGVVPVFGDPVRLQQIASNLLSNATRYTRDGGIAVSLAVEGEAAVLRVRDSGVGMTTTEQSRAFELFYQGQQGIDRADGGLGVGLHLAKNLAEIHGGSIEARSDGRDRGSEFVVRLPLHARAEALVTRRDARPAGRLRIALVEDNADIRETMKDLLRAEGHEVLEASDGEAGVELVLSQRPDVAVVDIGLPRLDGYSVARRIRERVGGSVRLVAVSGYGRPEDRAASAEAGFDAHLVKPVETDRLFEAVGRIGGGGGGERYAS
jgi:two-component system CheB/CheR fusion protein